MALESVATIFDGFVWEHAVRLLAAVACGLMLGFNRDLKGKPTGMRTLGLVSLGACLVSLAALEDPGLRNEPDALSRVVQGVLQGILTGVGFIGAGVILKDTSDHRVRGLTTAATVWLTAALGIACALAKWPLIIMGLGLSLLVLLVPHHFGRRFGAQSTEDDG
ncbi:MgtC/SapB family protein [Hansschlegelia sp.]|uniref:MgtC/SapB family protein n=1 Tax=Hansschlegelia sp. TaxID=2041892 RepID=UPI002B58BDAC|nr:MgtC/SapB family protein [Hansschlegelia sp.]HVI29146.1 MgtC/SapB family protein [Hansschlegelia sp.]